MTNKQFFFLSGELRNWFKQWLHIYIYTCRLTLILFKTYFDIKKQKKSANIFDARFLGGSGFGEK